jgi:hypothetical protein
MTTAVDICNRALQMAAARATITALNDGSNEANNCNLLYEPLLKQTLSLAHWNFARKMENLQLVKSAPGTPQFPTSLSVANQWIPAYPAPPWFYEYRYPSDCLQFRYLASQPTAINALGTPIFSTQTYTFDPMMQGVPQKFVVASDTVGPLATITGITRANPAVVTAAAHGYSNGQTVLITSVVGMTEVNNTMFTIGNVAANTFELTGIDSSSYDAYVAGGVAVNQSAAATRRNVILTNACVAMGCYTMLIDDLDLWSDGAIQAFVSALAGFLVIPLGGHLNLAKMLVAQANDHILQARAEDANEGMITQDWTPDWIRIRDSDTLQGFPGGGYYIAPYPPLFAVS